MIVFQGLILHLDIVIDYSRVTLLTISINKRTENIHVDTE